jgi:hypothetical protein
MRQIRNVLLALLATLYFAAPVRASAPETAPEDEADIRALIDEWYVQHRAGADGRPYTLRAPGAIDASPGYIHIDTGSRALGPAIYNSLAATSLKFDHEITRLVRDPHFARVHVWERGYFYAWAAQQTYERAGDTTFVLEKQADGRWLVLAHETNTVGIPPNRKTEPMPDLRELYYSTDGKARDPATDSDNAGKD